jgi:hypothetical protein
MRTSARRPGVAVCWLVFVSLIVSSPFVTPSRTRTRAKAKHPSPGAEAAKLEGWDATFRRFRLLTRRNVFRSGGTTLSCPRRLAPTPLSRNRPCPCTSRPHGRRCPGSGSVEGAACASWVSGATLSWVERLQKAYPDGRRGASFFAARRRFAGKNATPRLWIRRARARNARSLCRRRVVRCRLSGSPHGPAPSRSRMHLFPAAVFFAPEGEPLTRNRRRMVLPLAPRATGSNRPLR